jgi:hypothetical protein
MKAFISTWKLYLGLLAHQQPVGTPLNWRLTVMLNYLGQFEAPCSVKWRKRLASTATRWYVSVATAAVRTRFLTDWNCRMVQQRR